MFLDLTQTRGYPAAVFPIHRVIAGVNIKHLPGATTITNCSIIIRTKPENNMYQRYHIQTIDKPKT